VYSNEEQSAAFIYFFEQQYNSVIYGGPAALRATGEDSSCHLNNGTDIVFFMFLRETTVVQ
jgi:hypothetical protein